MEISSLQNCRWWVVTCAIVLGRVKSLKTRTSKLEIESTPCNHFDDIPSILQCYTKFTSHRFIHVPHKLGCLGDRNNCNPWLYHCWKTFTNDRKCAAIARTPSFFLHMYTFHLTHRDYRILVDYPQNNDKRHEGRGKIAFRRSTKSIVVSNKLQSVATSHSHGTHHTRTLRHRINVHQQFCSNKKTCMVHARCGNYLWNQQLLCCIEKRWHSTLLVLTMEELLVAFLLNVNRKRILYHLPRYGNGRWETDWKKISEVSGF